MPSNCQTSRMVRISGAVERPDRRGAEASPHLARYRAAGAHYIQVGDDQFASVQFGDEGVVGMAEGLFQRQIVGVQAAEQQGGD